jgi:hypothetical protein
MLAAAGSIKQISQWLFPMACKYASALAHFVAGIAPLLSV